jgi:hypothetical protein
MPKIHAMFNIYEEKTNIIAALNSIAPYVDKVWIFDGTVKQFPAKPDWNSYAEAPASRDGTLELVKDWQRKARTPSSIYESKEIWEDESIKKNFLLNKIPVGDYVIQLDGDELFFATAGLNLRQLVAESYQVPILFTGHASFKPTEAKAWLQPRVWVNSPTRRFRPPSKEQLINFGKFVSQATEEGQKPDNPRLVLTSEVIKKPVEAASFSGEQKLVEQQKQAVSDNGTSPVLQAYILNNPTVREIDRQKRRLIYYNRIFGVNLM